PPLISSLGGLEDAAELLFLQRTASAERYAGKRIVGDRHGKTGFVAQHLIEALKQSAPASEDNPLVANIGGKLRRGILERNADALDDGADGLGEGFGDLALVDRNLFGHAVDKVATLDVDGLADAVDGR